MYILASKFRFLEFRLLLSRVAPYYSSLPQTVWLIEEKQNNRKKHIVFLNLKKIKTEQSK